ncbi:MAG: hypothetical protein ACPGUD_08845 [Parashewanella sp.]
MGSVIHATEVINAYQNRTESSKDGDSSFYLDIGIANRYKVAISESGNKVNVDIRSASTLTRFKHTFQDAIIPFQNFFLDLICSDGRQVVTDKQQVAMLVGKQYISERYNITPQHGAGVNIQDRPLDTTEVPPSAPFKPFVQERTPLLSEHHQQTMTFFNEGSHRRAENLDSNPSAPKRNTDQRSVSVRSSTAMQPSINDLPEAENAWKALKNQPLLTDEQCGLIAAHPLVNKKPKTVKAILNKAIQGDALFDLALHKNVARLAIEYYPVAVKNAARGISTPVPSQIHQQSQAEIADATRDLETTPMTQADFDAMIASFPRKERSLAEFHLTHGTRGVGRGLMTIRLRHSERYVRDPSSAGSQIIKKAHAFLKERQRQGTLARVEETERPDPFRPLMGVGQQLDRVLGTPVGQEFAEKYFAINNLVAGLRIDEHETLMRKVGLHRSVLPIKTTRTGANKVINQLGEINPNIITKDNNSKLDRYLAELRRLRQ